jgi:hypothetical protein
MGAIGLLARSMLRRRVAVTLGLALAIGLPLGLAGAGIQAWRRADGAIERHHDRASWYQVSVSACPPGVDPSDLPLEDIASTCLTPELIDRFTHEVLRDRTDVVDLASASTNLVAIVDPTAPNGWGWPITVLDGANLRPALVQQIFIAGRPFDEDRPDEVVIGEAAAAKAGIHVGDTITLRSWAAADRDAAPAGSSPTTEPFRSTVVGIVRTIDDLQSTHDDGDPWLPNYLYAGRAWTDAHTDGLAGYGRTTLVRVAGGESGVAEFRDAMQAQPGGWSVDVRGADTVDASAIERVVALERNAVLVVAIITAVATLALGGLMLTRQLRRELAQRPALAAIGMRRRDLQLAAALRMLTLLPSAMVVAAVVTVGLSPFTPLGRARDVEYSHPIRLDNVALAVGAILVAALGVVPVLLAGSPPRLQPTRRPGRLEHSRQLLPTVPRLGVQQALRGAQPMTVLVVAMAIVAASAAACVVASLDALLDHPGRYGGWYDVSIGQYSMAATYEHDAAAVRELPVVADAAAVLDDGESLMIAGRQVPWIAFVPLVGDIEPVMREGRPPRTDDEIAIGRGLAKSLGVRVGDEVHWVKNDGRVEGTLRIVGEVVFSDPVTTSVDPGRGVLAAPGFSDVINRCDGCAVPQSIAIRLDPAADRAAAITSIGAARHATHRCGQSRPASLRPTAHRGHHRRARARCARARLAGDGASASPRPRRIVGVGHDEAPTPQRGRGGRVGNRRCRRGDRHPGGRHRRASGLARNRRPLVPAAVPVVRVGRDSPRRRDHGRRRRCRCVARGSAKHRPATGSTAPDRVT